MITSFPFLSSIGQAFSNVPLLFLFFFRSLVQKLLRIAGLTKIQKNEEVMMCIKKEYFNDSGKCRVTFILPRGVGKNVKKAQVVGEFNRWAHSASPMKKLKNGTFVAIMELPIYMEYQFRYLLDNKVWMNDSDADRFVPTPFGDGENCVLSTFDDSHIDMIKANQLKPRSTASNVQPLLESFSDK